MKIVKINAVWCPGCLVSKKIWANVEAKYPNHEYIAYDFDLDEDEIEHYNVGDILPVVIIEDNDGKEVTRIIGEKSEKEVMAVLQEVMK